MAKMTSESFTITKKFSTFSIIIKLHANKDEGLYFMKPRIYYESIRPKKKKIQLEVGPKWPFSRTLFTSEA